MNEPKIIQLRPGVELWWLPTDKFQVFRWEFNFITPQKRAQTTRRKLLVNLLQRSSKQYTTQAQLARQLSLLYGAEITGKTSILRNLNILSLAVTAPAAFQTTSLIQPSLNLLYELVAAPNLQADHQLFLESAFQLEQTNLANFYQSLQDDYALKASLGLKQILASADFQVPAFGSLTQLHQVTNEQVSQQYHDLMKQDRLIMTLVGDPNNQAATAFLQQLDLMTTRTQPINLEAQQLLIVPKHPLCVQQHEPIQQSQLVMAYHSSIKHSAAVWQVFNMMLGGDDQSLLFTNVREQKGLAYSIYSTVNVFEGLVTVQAGISADQIETAQELIQQQITHLAEQEDERLLQHAQLALINQRLIDSDNIVHQSERLLLKALNSHFIWHDSDYAQQIQAVQLAEVQDLAAQLQLSAQYQLIGDNK